MKNKMKMLVLAGICFVTTAVCGVLTQKANVVAAETLTDIQAVAGHFQMVDGAEVRLATNASGIRFRTTVSKEWYDLATKDGATVKFYTIVNKYNNEDANEWSAPIEATEKVDFSNGVTKYEFTGAIVYNALSEEYLSAAYNLQLEAKSYAEISKEGEETITVYADKTNVDTIRSVAEVADNLMRTEGATADLTPEKLSILDGFRIIEKANVYIDKTNGTFDVTTVIKNAEVLKVVMDDENDTYADGVYNFNDEITTAASASSAIIYTNLGIIETDFNVCTKVIKTATDWTTVFNATSLITGYYYLDNDITDYPTIAITKKISSDYAFKGVFDGGGHTASFTVQRKQGIFAYLSAATIKNVQFNLKFALSHPSNTSLCGNMSGLAGTIWNNVKISDMYLKIEDVKSANGIFAPITDNAAYPITLTRCVIEMPTEAMLTASGLDTSKISSFATTLSSFDTVTAVEDDWNWYFKSEIFVISDLPLARNIKSTAYSAASAFTVYAPNTMPDKDGDNVITASDIDTENKITYLGQVANGGPIYSYASIDALKAVEYDWTKSTYATNALWDITSGAPVFVGK